MKFQQVHCSLSPISPWSAPELKQKRAQYNTGNQSGNSGQVFNIGSGGGEGGASAADLKPDTPLAYTKHDAETYDSTLSEKFSNEFFI